MTFDDFFFFKESLSSCRLKEIPIAVGKERVFLAHEMHDEAGDHLKQSAKECKTISGSETLRQMIICNF